MPITKITLVTGPELMSYYTTPPTDQKYLTLDLAWKQTYELAKRLDKIAALIVYLQNLASWKTTVLDGDITAGIIEHVGNEKITVKRITKKKTQYWIPNLYIHTEN